MKIVFDTNVLLAGFGTRGLCEAIVTGALAGHEVVVSKPILDEFETHLVKFKVPRERVVQLVAYLKAQCTSVAPTDVPAGACRDPNDLMVLGTAVAGNADVLVTGDKDLLTLGAFEGIPILSPRQFYETLHRTDEA